MRGYLERCNVPPVKNFVAWVSPQMGVYGVPKVVFHLLAARKQSLTHIPVTTALQVGGEKYLNVTLDDIADCCIYDDWAQELLAFAGYWRGAVTRSVLSGECCCLRIEFWCQIRMRSLNTSRKRSSLLISTTREQ